MRQISNSRQQRFWNYLLEVFGPSPSRQYERGSHHALVGGMFDDMRRLRKAVRLLSRAIDRGHRGADAYNWRGQAYLDLGAFSAAIQDLTRFIEAVESDERPDDTRYIAYFWRARAYWGAGELSNAERDYGTAISVHDSEFGPTTPMSFPARRERVLVKLLLEQGAAEPDIRDSYIRTTSR